MTFITQMRKITIAVLICSVVSLFGVATVQADSHINCQYAFKNRDFTVNNGADIDNCLVNGNMIVIGEPNSFNGATVKGNVYVVHGGKLDRDLDLVASNLIIDGGTVGYDVPVEDVHLSGNTEVINGFFSGTDIGSFGNLKSEVDAVDCILERSRFAGFLDGDCTFPMMDVIFGSD